MGYGGQCCTESDLGQRSGGGVALNPFLNSRLGDKYLVSSSQARKCPRLCEQDLQKPTPRGPGLLGMAAAF